MSWAFTAMRCSMLRLMRAASRAPASTESIALACLPKVVPEMVLRPFVTTAGADRSSVSSASAAASFRFNSVVVVWCSIMRATACSIRSAAAVRRSSGVVSTAATSRVSSCMDSSTGCSFRWWLALVRFAGVMCLVVMVTWCSEPTHQNRCMGHPICADPGSSR
jgi:hypothetical protein